MQLKPSAEKSSYPKRNKKPSVNSTKPKVVQVKAKKFDLPVHSLLGVDLNFIIDEMLEWNTQLAVLSKVLKLTKLETPERVELEHEFEMLLRKIQIRSESLLETMDDNDQEL